LKVASVECEGDNGRKKQHPTEAYAGIEPSPQIRMKADKGQEYEQEALQHVSVFYGQHQGLVDQFGNVELQQARLLVVCVIKPQQ
jgi:hypothetical protein